MAESFLIKYNTGSKTYGQSTCVGDLPTGTSVYLNVDGVSTEFIIVHQGLPDKTYYDISCQGTWLLMKGTYSQSMFNSQEVGKGANFKDSILHSYLNTTFLNLLDEGVSSYIKTAKIPYCRHDANESGVYTNTSNFIGSDGVESKVFVLSPLEYYENVKYGSLSAYKDGVQLDYFKSKSYYINIDVNYWTRSIHNTWSDKAWKYCIYMDTSGAAQGGLCSLSYDVRPAMILSFVTPVDENYNIIL